MCRRVGSRCLRWILVAALDCSGIPGRSANAILGSGLGRIQRFHRGGRTSRDADSEWRPTFAKAGTSILAIADAVPVIMVSPMDSSGPSPSPDAKRRGGSVPKHSRWATSSQEPEPQAPAKAGVAQFSILTSGARRP
jgi:hypothetical protein